MSSLQDRKKTCFLTRMSIMSSPGDKGRTCCWHPSEGSPKLSVPQRWHSSQCARYPRGPTSTWPSRNLGTRELTDTKLRPSVMPWVINGLSPSVRPASLRTEPTQPSRADPAAVHCCFWAAQQHHLLCTPSILHTLLSCSEPDS